MAQAGWNKHINVNSTTRILLHLYEIPHHTIALWELLLALTTVLSAIRKMVTMEPKEIPNIPTLSEITWGCSQRKLYAVCVEASKIQNRRRNITCGLRYFQPLRLLNKSTASIWLFILTVWAAFWKTKTQKYCNTNLNNLHVCVQWCQIAGVSVIQRHGNVTMGCQQRCSVLHQPSA